MIDNNTHISGDKVRAIPTEHGRQSEICAADESNEEKKKKKKMKKKTFHKLV